MSSPQLENGYTRIANEILEHLAMPGISGSELRIVIFVLRKTYGFGKKSDYISLTQFQKGTLMNRSHVVRTIKELVHKRILGKEKSVYGINKNWEQWLVHKRIPSTQKDTIASTQKDTKSSTQKDTHKRKKETITKETSGETPQRVFSLKEEIRILEESPRRDLNIIAMYLEKKNPDIRSPEQLSVAIKRHLRGAGQLCPFTDQQILDAVPRARKLTEEYTLETITKVLTK